jgi:chemotaxis protein CheX
MGDLMALDLKTFVNGCVTEVFDTMLSMQVNMGDIAQSPSLNGERIVGTVSFAGEVMGNISIHLKSSFGRAIAAAMLGMDESEIESDEEVFDVIGEVSNMVGGDLKSRLCDAGFPCQLSIPSITTGSDFKIESKGWVRCERFLFKSQEQSAIVEIFIKPA